MHLQMTMLHIPNKGPCKARHGFGKHNLKCFNAARVLIIGVLQVLRHLA